MAKGCLACIRLVEWESIYSLPCRHLTVLLRRRNTCTRIQRSSIFGRVLASLAVPQLARSKFSQLGRLLPLRNRSASRSSSICTMRIKQQYREITSTTARLAAEEEQEQDHKAEAHRAEEILPHAILYGWSHPFDRSNRNITAPKRRKARVQSMQKIKIKLKCERFSDLTR